VKIAHLTAGTGNFFCGSCLRDHALVAALRRQGHDARFLPMYLPPVLDSGEGSGGECPLFFGGINVYLQQKSWLSQHSPAWLDALLNRPGLLRWAAGRAGMTSARDLGEITVSMLRGSDGRQGKELRKLTDWLLANGPWDVVSLSNGLLLGLAPAIKAALGCRVVGTLQGEDAFLDSLAQPWRSQSWQLVSARAAEVDALIAVSDWYAATMAGRLGLPVARIVAVHNGLDLDGYAPAAGPILPPAIGFLARLHAGKGLATLVDAFIALKTRTPGSDLRLRIAGSCTPSDQPFVEGLRQRLAAVGLDASVDWQTNLTLEEKQTFLRSISVLSVPATYGEAFGLYLVEAWASGVPVVQPRSAAFPELVAATQGGALCAPDDPASLADALAKLLADPAAARAQGSHAREVVLKEFTADAMAKRFLAAAG